MPTAATIPLILLVAVLWYYTKGRILAIVLFTSIFDAASALDFGTMGVSPWLFTLILCLTIKVLQGHRPPQLAPGINKIAFRLVLLFFAYAAWSGLVYPFIFRGIPVVKAIDPVPLEWSISNLAQLCYLLADCIIFSMAVSSSKEELEIAVDWYVRGCIVAAFFAIYQLANATIHIPYPDAILYSNKAHVVYRAYKMGGLWRLNSTFTEASDMAGFMTVAAGLLGWTLFTRPLRLGRSVNFVLIVVSILLTFSSTGYLVMAFMLLLGGFLYIRYLMRLGGISAIKLIAMILLLAGMTSSIASESARATVSKVVRSVLLDKDKSASYRARAESHTQALAALSDTYYMGAGWGSIRASGFAFFLLGTVGVVGLTLFCSFYLSLFLPLFRRRGQDERDSLNDLLERSLFGVSILLCGLAAAGSEPTLPVLWVLFGVATLGRSFSSSGMEARVGAPLDDHRYLPRVA